MNEPKTDVDVLSNTIAGVAAQQEIPDRFEVSDIPGRPVLMITDTQTDLSTEVPLFVYREVRRVLSDLFPDDLKRDGKRYSIFIRDDKSRYDGRTQATIESARRRLAQFRGTAYDLAIGEIDNKGNFLRFVE